MKLRTRLLFGEAVFGLEYRLRGAIFLLNDGGDSRQFGWGRYNPNLKSVNGAPKLKIAKAVKRLRIYDRYLRTSEAIAAHRAGKE